MNADTPVVIIRQKEGPDIVGILGGVKIRDDGISAYVIEHPFIPYVDHSQEAFSLAPYCYLSDQTTFEFLVKDTVFMIPTKKDLQMEYLKGLAKMNAVSVSEPEEERKQKLAFKHALKTLTLSPGTETLQ